MNYNGTTYYYITNIQGDVLKIVNSSGTAVATYTYNACGELLSSSGSLAAINPIRTAATTTTSRQASTISRAGTTTP